MTTHAILTTLLLSSVAAAAGLVAIWAATSQQHWFWRALAVWACVAVLLPIRVWEPAMVFAVALPGIVALVQGPLAIRGWLGSTHAQRLRFELLDILLVMVLVGLSLVVVRWIAQFAPRVSVYEFVVPAVVMAGLAGAAYWMVAGPRRGAAGLAMVLIVVLGAWLAWPEVKWLNAIDSLGLGAWDVGARAQSRELYFRGLQLCCGGWFAFVAMLVLGAIVVLPRPMANPNSRSLQVCRVIVAAAVSLFFIWLYLPSLRHNPFPPPFESPDNRAPRILEIAERVRELNPWQRAIPGVKPARAHPAATAQELNHLYEELLLLLEESNSTPFIPSDDSSRAYVREAMGHRVRLLRDLCQSLEAEWRDAESKGDREHAIGFALAIGRIAMLQCRNCTESDCAIGHALTGISQAYFIERRMSLTEQQAARVTAFVRRADAEHEPLESIHLRQLAVFEREYGWQRRLSEVLNGGRNEEWSFEHMRASYDRWQAMNWLLTTDLAIRQYRREHGAWPALLADLVPIHLESLPIDPYSGVPLEYLALGDDFVLYSVGPDRIDNGGHFGTGSDLYRDGFDLDLDTYTREYGTEVLPGPTSDEPGSGQEMNHQRAKDPAATNEAMDHG